MKTINPSGCRITLRFLFVTAIFGLSSGWFLPDKAAAQVIKRGERPPIDIMSVPDDAMEQGIIRIKFSRSAEALLDNHLPSTDPRGIVQFGLPGTDQLNRQFGVTEVRKTFAAAMQNTRFADRHRAWGFHLWYDLIVSERTDLRAMVSAYTLPGEIELSEPVYRKHLIGNVMNPIQLPPETGLNYTPNDPQYNAQWHYHNTGQQGGTTDADIDLPEAWNINRGDTEVIVAIVDQGIQYTHPDLAGNMWSGIGYNFVDDSPTIVPGDHGTHVAGTVAANTNNGTGVSGVAGGDGSGNGVRLMSCQVFIGSSGGSGFENAPVYAADNDAAISQNSWGYNSSGYYEQAVLDAIDYFNANGGGSLLNGGITIYAAGNSGTPGQWYPAYYSGAFSVAATNNQDQKAYYSNYDSWIDIAAPGGETIAVIERGVLSCLTGSSYGFYQGTSMACPHVSGVAALIISLAPGQLYPQDIKDILTSTADDIDALNPDYTGMLGSGRMNAYEALLATQDYINPLLPAAPQNFSAEAQNENQINLNWQPNTASDIVMLAWNSTNNFGIPSGNYLPGQSIPGGGTVLYEGTLTDFEHSGLEPATTYYYALWSKNTGYYSAVSRKANATTSCGILDLPFSESFGGFALPNCWSQQNPGASTDHWSFSATNLAAGAVQGEAKCYWQGGGSATRLVTPPINTLGVNSIDLTFSHLLDDYGTGATLRVQSSTDGINWTNEAWSMISVDNTNKGPFITQTTVESNLNSPVTYIAFTVEGNISAIDNWYIDDITAEAVNMDLPVVITSPVTDITDATATSGGEVVFEGTSEVTARGVCYGTSPDPALSDNFTVNGQGTGAFISQMINLSPITTYYVRAYATNGSGTAYGNNIEFSTNCGIVSLPFDENFNNATFPECWSQTSTISDRWTVSNSANAGGAPNEMMALWTDGTGISRLIAPPLNTNGFSELTLTFRHFFDDWDSGLIYKIQSSSDGLSWTDESWVNESGNGNESGVISTPITYNLGSTTYIAWVLEGDHYNFDAWYIDGISIEGTSSDKTLNLSLFIEGFWNGSGMNQAQDVDQDENIFNKFNGTTVDTLSVYLAEANAPWAIVYAAHAVSINTDGSLIIPVPAAFTGSYYIVIDHHSSVETWSAMPIDFSGTTVDFDFTTAEGQAYGSNQKSMGSVWAIYTGDVGDDEYIEFLDVVAIYNLSVAAFFGYSLFDLDGNGYIEFLDYIIAHNNSVNGVGMNTPPNPAKRPGNFSGKRIE
jgi:subtilisin family serine protease